MDIKTPAERIVRIDLLALAFNSERMIRDRKRVVDLACSHVSYTAAVNKVRCPRCAEMLRRSLDGTGSEDYEGFRAGQVIDHMIWKADPCRQFNEPTDLEGNFLND